MRCLLTTTDGELLFVGGCAPNMRQFYPEFEHIVLLSAPPHLLRERLATRTTNAYGKHPDELTRVLRQVQTVEPLLRRVASLEVDTSAPLVQVIEPSWTMCRALEAEARAVEPCPVALAHVGLRRPGTSHFQLAAGFRCICVAPPGRVNPLLHAPNP